FPSGADSTEIPSAAPWRNLKGIRESAELEGYGRCCVKAGMSRHLARSPTGATHRDRATERFRRKAPTSALSGHLEYVELAERMGQGVTVEDAPGSSASKTARKSRQR